ncbi:MAG: hypothetical protein ACREJC_03205 [Tepidisphaeraceae bacterium]
MEADDIIPILRVKDAAVAVAWYKRLGLVSDDVAYSVNRRRRG